MEQAVGILLFKIYSFFPQHEIRLSDVTKNIYGSVWMMIHIKIIIKIPGRLHFHICFSLFSQLSSVQRQTTERLKKT
jgi:hypothetical protein